MLLRSNYGLKHAAWPAVQGLARQLAAAPLLKPVRWPHGEMSRRDRDALGDKSLVLVFIAGSAPEAERAEAALRSAGIDYCFKVEDFTQGILSSPRAGLGFYVVEGRAPFARRELAQAKLASGVIEADT
jgi:hypothetical protein